MIRLRVKDLQQASPRCHKDCKHFEVTGCPNGCRFRFRTEFKCPGCSYISAYYGSNNPIYCPGCKKPLPDFWKMLRPEYEGTRISEHLS